MSSNFLSLFLPHFSPSSFLPPIISWMKRKGLAIVNRKELKKKCNYEILEIEEVYEHAVYSVRNCKKKTEYLVTINPDTCSCEAFSHYTNCKHIIAVKELKEKEKERRDNDPEHAADTGIAIERTAELMVLE